MKAFLVYVLLLILTCLPKTAMAASDAVSICIGLQSSGWAAQEQWVWEKLCNREAANLNQRAGQSGAPRAWQLNDEEWTQERVISSSFLYDILLNEPYRGALENIPITIAGAWYIEVIDIAGARIQNYLNLTGSRFDADFSIMSSTMESRFAATNSWFRGEFNFNNMTTEEVIMMNNRFDDAVLMFELHSTGVVVVEGSDFSNYLNLAGLRAVRLVLRGSNSDPIWRENAQFSLRGAHIELLEDSEASWDGLAGKLDMQGFTYDGFGGTSGSFNPTQSAGSSSERTVESLLAWLEMQESREEIYIPQPYEQLAGVLYSVGQDAKADRILYEKNEYQRLHKTTALSDKAWLSIKKIVIGYGYQIWLTIIWLLGLIGFGALMLFRSPQGKPLGFGRCCLYSLDQAIPLIDLDPKHQDLAREQRPSLDYYFKGQQILSLILISFLGAGLAGAIG